MKTIDELGISNTPWEYDEESNDIICYLHNGLKYQVAVPYIHSDEETDANARLIASAPELYEALARVITQGGLAICGGATKDMALKALAKASGEEENNG